MDENYTVLNIENAVRDSRQSLALDVLEGLSQKPKTIPSKYLYDDRGSKLFEQITKQKEYYPTKSEFEILNIRKEDIRRLASNEPFRLLELGAGDAHKTKVLLQNFLKYDLQFEYILVDCCAEMVQHVVDALSREYRNTPLRVRGIIADYSTALTWLEQKHSMRNMVLFLGSSIGNFNLQQTQHFLRELWNSLNDGDAVFIGFDLKKDIDILQNAYNDSAGITREFNMNLLDRINRELQADFDRNLFKHHSFYNPSEGRMESWIISTQPQDVTIHHLQKTFSFNAWEGIHVENSYKYSINELQKLAEFTGFSTKDLLVDSRGYFADVIWNVIKNTMCITGEK